MDVARDVVLFVLVVFGLGLPVALTASRWSSLERLTLAVAAALVGIYVVGLVLYWTDAPRWAVVVLPLGAVVAVGRRPAQARALLADDEVRHAGTLWLVLALWCVGLHALIVSYSGGGWTNDWWEHYDRARFFAERWPHTTRFLGSYTLPARPPFANVVTAAFLSLTETTFARYQVFMTLLSSLAFIPALLLCRAFGGGPRAGAGLLLLFMANPLFVQNATFAWTKLLSAYFVLGGLAFVAGGARRDPWRTRTGWLMLSAGLLCHYSAGAWMIAAAAGMLLTRRHELRSPAFWREQAATAACCAVLLLSWFAWSWGVYGLQRTVGDNTTVGGAAAHTATEQLLVFARNVWNTIVPQFVRRFDGTLLPEEWAFGPVRDFFFTAYQHNLFFAFGSGVAVALVWLVATGRAHAFRGPYWRTVVPVAFLAGIAVVTWPDDLGTMELCLQPLVLLGLALVAASGNVLPRSLRWLAIGGMAVDLLLGVVLHLGVESFAFTRWAHPRHPDASHLADLGKAASVNYMTKEGLLREPFLADILKGHVGAIGVMLGVLLLVAAWLGTRPGTWLRGRPSPSAD